MLDVLIGIQARSGSTRLPRKAWELISGRTMLDRCIEAASYTSKMISKRGLNAEIVVVTPTGDPIVSGFSGRVRIVEGPEFDVLGRYALAVEKYNPRYLVRMTGDCPLLPPYVQDGIIKIAMRENMDYLSNTHERFRTSIDGYDTEVLSRKMFDWLVGAASETYDREHVTTMARREPPHWAKVGTVLNATDQSHIKLSVDTAEDLDFVRQEFEKPHNKHQDAIRALGYGNVFRL